MHHRQLPTCNKWGIQMSCKGGDQTELRNQPWSAREKLVRKQATKKDEGRRVRKPSHGKKRKETGRHKGTWRGHRGSGKGGKDRRKGRIGRKLQLELYEENNISKEYLTAVYGLALKQSARAGLGTWEAGWAGSWRGWAGQEARSGGKDTTYKSPEWDKVRIRAVSPELERKK